MDLEGIVSKRLDIRYRSGRSRLWVTVVKPAYEPRTGA
jgi:ATP-dependent DNA ligase